jgi:hypothetical protein
VREADAESPGVSGPVHSVTVTIKNGDDGGLFALHARRSYTDWEDRQVTARE